MSPSPAPASAGTVLVLGGNGFIAGHVIAALRGDGWRVLRGIRDPGRPLHDDERVCDFTAMTAPADWRAALAGVDAVVNAAGILRAAHTHEMSLEQWNQIIGVNLTGTFLVIRAALPELLVNPKSVIVNFSSTSASFAHPYMAAYAASKGGIQSMTHTLALEYGRQGLRAVCVAPGGIKSGITDATGGYLPADTDWSLLAKLSPVLPTTLDASGAPMGDPAAVASVIAMLVSEDGAYITGTEIRVDGGAHT